MKSNGLLRGNFKGLIELELSKGRAFRQSRSSAAIFKLRTFNSTRWLKRSDRIFRFLECVQKLVYLTRFVGMLLEQFLTLGNKVFHFVLWHVPSARWAGRSPRRSSAFLPTTP